VIDVTGEYLFSLGDLAKLSNPIVKANLKLDKAAAGRAAPDKAPAPQIVRSSHFLNCACNFS